MAERRVGRLRPGLAKLDSRLPHLRRPEQQDAQMETDRLGVREDPHERAEPAEGCRRVALVEPTDGRGDECVRVIWSESRRCRKLALGRDRVPELLQREAVEDLRANVP